jgi:protein gp37
MDAEIGHNSSTVNAAQLLAYVERIERVNESITDLNTERLGRKDPQEGRRHPRAGPRQAPRGRGDPRSVSLSAGHVMSEKTGIEWTDATINFWWGCTKVGPGCDHCYAETWSKRTGESIWGVGVPRRKIKGASALIHKLDNGYADWSADHAGGFLPAHCGPRRRVFIQSMSDIFDLEVPDDWFVEAWGLIRQCDRLEIQLVTKRVTAVEKRLKLVGGDWPKHAGLMVTVVNQDEADRDVPRALDLKERLGIPWIGLSIEPMLGSIKLHHDWLGWKRCVCSERAGSVNACNDCDPCLGAYGRKFVDWTIVGGESSRDARPMHPSWARSIRDQCAAYGVPFFMKQMTKKGPIPDDLMVRQFPK